MALLGLPDALAIFLAAGIFSLITNVINRAMGITKRRIELQKIQKDYQKRSTDAIKRNDEKELDKLKEEEKVFMKTVQESMMLPFKSMIFILPLFFVFLWFMEGNMHGFAIQLPFALHLNGHELLGLNVFQESTYGPRGLFILSSVLAGSVIEFIAGKTMKN
ncbi:MAG: EMC3/TMCO1 family protein [Candidatus Micrarchaeota archaeon]